MSLNVLASKERKIRKLRSFCSCEKSFLEHQKGAAYYLVAVGVGRAEVGDDYLDVVRVHAEVKREVRLDLIMDSSRQVVECLTIH